MPLAGTWLWLQGGSSANGRARRDVQGHSSYWLAATRDGPRSQQFRARTLLRPQELILGAIAHTLRFGAIAADSLPGQVVPRRAVQYGSPGHSFKLRWKQLAFANPLFVQCAN